MGPPRAAGATSVSNARQPLAYPACHRRLVIISSRSGRTGAGAFVPRQLWGCPREHATAEYAADTFGAIEVPPGCEWVKGRLETSG